MSIVKKFGTHDISFHKDSEEIWINGENIAEALGYEEPEKAESRVYSRNKELLSPYIINPQIEDKSSAGRPKVTRYYNEIGVSLFIMKARTARAEELQVWMALQLKEMRQENKLTPAEVLLENAKRFVELEKQGLLTWGLVQEHDKKIEHIEKKLLPKAKINEEQAENVREAVCSIAYMLDSDNPPFSRIFGNIKQLFGFASYREMPATKYPAVIDYLNDWAERLTTGNS
ncbi:MAG: BRO family protein [Candidatus Odinarchaeota archaeon]